MRSRNWLLTLGALLLAAGTVSANVQDKVKEDQKKGKAVAAPTAAGPVESVSATVETEPVPSGGDAADDPAIWVHPSDPAASTIIGTDKQGGLVVYDLAGKQLQYLPDGKMDNVDLRPGFPLGGERVTLVTAGNRQDNSIAVYRVDPQTRKLENVAARKVTTLPVYGSCMYRSAKTGKFYYFANSKSGGAEQWELFDNGGGKVDARKVRSFKVGTVTEGCVGRRAFVTTPNRWFPVEVHTRTPLLHFLPKPAFDRYLHRRGLEWATGDYMRLLGRREFAGLLAEAGFRDVHLIANRVGPFAVDFVAVSASRP